MVLTVADIIKDMMSLIHVRAIDETPDTSQYDQAMRVLNVMLDRWSSQRLLLRSTTPISFPLVVGKGSYTIGASGSNITANKPLKIISAYKRDESGVDYPIEIIPIEQYNNLTDKSVSMGEVLYLSYDPGAAQQAAQQGTIYVYYEPSTPETIYMEADCYFTEFTAITDTVTLEPAYYEPLIYNGAVRLFRYYRDAGIQVPADIMAIANNSLNNLKTLNAVPFTASLDLPGGKVNKYNIYTDQG